MSTPATLPRLPTDDGHPYPVLIPLIQRCLERDISVLLRGHPGIGKTALAYDLAARMSLPVIDIRLAQKDPAELGGVYVPNRDTRVLELYPPEWVQQACDIPVFIFLDEVNAAVSKLHQAAAYQIILEHRIGSFTFHHDTVVMAAGNLEEDQALAVPLSSALQNRFAHFTLAVDTEAWIAWATAKGLSPDIIAYIAFRREPVLYRHTDGYAWPSPRSWSMAAQADGHDKSGTERKRLIAACVGDAAATEFQAFHTIYRQVDVTAILERGEIPLLANAEPGFVYALCYAVGYLLRAKGLKKDQTPNLLKLLQTPGFGPEFQVLLFKCVQGTKAFTAILNDPILEPVRASIVALVTTAETELR